MIGSMVEYPELIWSMFDTKTYNEQGVYSIRLHDMGVPISIVIDDFLPIDTSGGVTVGSEKQMWPLLLKKAFSKLMGNYKTCESRYWNGAVGF